MNDAWFDRRSLAGLICCLATVGTVWGQAQGVGGTGSAIIEGGLDWSSQFGNSEAKPIGDLDNDGINDIVAGAYMQNVDSGAVFLYTLSPSGAPVGSRFEFGPRNSEIAAAMGKNFGSGLAVMKPFSSSEPCAQVVTTTRYPAQIWMLEICREQVGGSISPKLKRARRFDSTNTIALKGMISDPWFGRSVCVIDTASDGDRIVAFGNPFDGEDGTTKKGSVLILRVDAPTWDLTKVGRLPESYGAGDALGSQLAASDFFGYSIAPLPNFAGSKVGVAVLAYGDDDLGSNFGIVYAIELDGDYKYKAKKLISGTTQPKHADLIGGAGSVASMDFNHDGVNDLLIGLPRLKRFYNNEGGFSITLLDADGAVKNVAHYRKTEEGISDPSNLINRDNYYLGSRIAAFDLQNDGMGDVIAGARGHKSDSGGVWVFKMKSAPWNRSQLDTIHLSVQDIYKKSMSELFGGNQLTYALTEITNGTVANCKLSGTQGLVEMACNARGINGRAAFVLTATDDGNPNPADHFSANDTFYINVSDGNRVPTSDLPPKGTVREDQGDTTLFSLDTYFHDADAGDYLTFEITPLGKALELIRYGLLNGNNLQITPLPNLFGLCTLRVSATDKFNAIIRDTLIIDVSAMPDAPQAVNDLFSLIEDNPQLLDVIANDHDIDGDSLSVTIVQEPKRGSATISGRKILYTPRKFEIGPDTIRYRVTDTTGLSATAEAQLTIQQVTGPPIVYKPLLDVSVSEDASPIVVHYDSVFFDGEDRFSKLQIKEINNCNAIASVSIDTVKKELTLTPKANASGDCRIILRAQDGSLASAMDTMALSISSVPDLYHFPQGNDVYLMRIPTNDSVVMPLDAIDLDGDSLKYDVVGALPAWMTVEYPAYRLFGKPPEDALDGAFSLTVHKKGETVQTDTLAIVVQIMSASGIKKIRVAGREGLHVFFSPKERVIQVVGFQGAHQIEVFRADGAVLVQKNGLSISEVIHLPAGEQGILLVRLSDQRGTSTFKLVKMSR